MSIRVPQMRRLGPVVTKMKTRTVGRWQDLLKAVEVADDYDTIEILPGEYFLPEPLNLTNKTGITLLGHGKSSVISSSFGLRGQPAQFPNGYPIIDLTGSDHCSLQDLTVVSNTGNTRRASCGIMLGRDATAASSGLHHFANVSVQGFFGTAAVVNQASEANTWITCEFLNYADVAGGASAYLLATAAQSAANPGVPQGVSSMLTQLFLNCYFSRSKTTENWSFDPEDCVIRMDSTGAVLGDIQIVGGNIATPEGTVGNALLTDRSKTGRAAIVLNVGYPMNNITIMDNRFECDGMKSGIHVTGDGLSGLYLNPDIWALNLSRNSWNFNERLLAVDDSGAGSHTGIRIRSLRVDEHVVSPRAKYPWAYEKDGMTFDVTNADRDSVHLDLALVDSAVVDMTGGAVLVDPDSDLTTPDASGVYRPRAKYRVRTTCETSRFYYTSASNFSAYENVIAAGQKELLS